mgnify:CR=1 FL=1
MRNTFARELTKLAKGNEKIVLLSGDIGNRMFDQFKSVNKERFINCGIAEGNMMSMAAGMALSGLRPVIYTITPFTTARCFEQIKIGAAYHNANIVIVGTGSGLSYAELGPTHHSLEDIGIISTLPDFRILTPCDSIELASQLKECFSLDGPTYIRIGKKGEPNLISENSNLSIGKANILKEGSDFLILGIGPILEEAIKASEKIKKRYNKSLSVVSFGSVEPLDEHFLLKMLSYKFKCWLTLEEHGFQGGFGSKINNWIYKNHPEKIEIININPPNEFIHYLGKQDYVRDRIGINSEGIIKKIKKYV